MSEMDSKNISHDKIKEHDCETLAYNGRIVFPSTGIFSTMLGSKKSPMYEGTELTDLNYDNIKKTIVERQEAQAKLQAKWQDKRRFDEEHQFKKSQEALAEANKCKAYHLKEERNAKLDGSVCDSTTLKACTQWKKKNDVWIPVDDEFKYCNIQDLPSDDRYNTFRAGLNDMNYMFPEKKNFLKKPAGRNQGLFYPETYDINDLLIKGGV